MTRPADVRISGPLARYARGFSKELAAQRYAPASICDHLRLMAHLSRWLVSARLEPRELSTDRVERFVRVRRRAGSKHLRSVRALAPLLAYLRRIQAVPPRSSAPPATARDLLVDEYVKYLRYERGLSNASIAFRERVARDFVRSTASRRGFDRVGAEHVRLFMLDRMRGYSVGAAGSLATAVRSLLRFLHLRGHVAHALASAVPKLAGWRQTSLPKALEPSQVDQILDRCDRRTSVGRRDYAILLLLVRLGLRAGEVTGLSLDDVDWRRGELLVRGKGNRCESMPLPADVGEALVAYLCRGRPPCEARTVFVSHRAPHRALGRCAVSAGVVRACIRAGIPRIGSHRLRHTAATQMLRRGGSLSEIAQVLRHRSVWTTAIYAKVDRDALRSLAQPWPAGGA